MLCRHQHGRCDARTNLSGQLKPNWKLKTGPEEPSTRAILSNSIGDGSELSAIRLVPPSRSARRDKPSDWTQFTGKGFACRTARSQSKLRHMWARRSIRGQSGPSSESPRTRRGIGAWHGSNRDSASAASTRAVLRQLKNSSTRAVVPNCTGDGSLAFPPLSR